MKIKKSQLKRIIKEGIRVVLNEADSMTSEQMKFAKPIFQAAAKKGGFKIGKIYMSFQPQAEIKVYEFGKTSSSMTSIWGHAFTKSDAMKLKKAWEQADMDIPLGEKGYKPKFHISTDRQYMTLYTAAEYAGVKYDKNEYNR